MSDRPDQDHPFIIRSRRSRLFKKADDNHVPLKTILTTVLVVALTFVVGKVLYRLRDVLLLMLVGGFIALLLNPLVNLLQRWKLPRRGAAVFVVVFVAVLAFIGLAVAFGYPLVNSTTHLAERLAVHREEGRAQSRVARPPSCTGTT